MTGSRGRDVRHLFGGVAFTAGTFACFTALTTLVGWAGGIEVLQRAGARFPPMMPNAALSLLGLGLSLAVLARRSGGLSGRAAHAVSFLVAAVGFLSVIQYLFPLDMGIDLLLFAETVAQVGYPYPGRIRASTAVALSLLGLALAIYDLPSEKIHRTAEILVIIVVVIALETLFRYAFGMEALLGPAQYHAIPIHMAVALLVLSGGTALLRPDRGRFRFLANRGAAGVALRRLIPVAVGGPFLMGWLTYVAVANELLSAVTGLTLFMSLMCALLLLAVGWTTRELNRIDQERLSLLRSEREARDQAEEANAAKSRFLGVMSHELRTPLNGVLAYADLLDAGIKGTLNEGQLGYVERIRISGSHLRSIIEEILLFTRSQRGAIEIGMHMADAVELAHEALAVVEHEVDPTRIQLQCQLPAEGLQLRTDPEKVLHVLVNLLGNALKFTEEGKVGLRLKVGRGTVVYEVWDSGPGVPPEDQERIFEEFAQLETHGSGRKGVGLGLAICRNYATMVGGRLELESWVGRGSVFRLVLPDQRTSGERAHVRPRRVARPSGRIRRAAHRWPGG